MRKRRTFGWAIEWHEVNRLDGERRELMGCGAFSRPEYMRGYSTMVFATRAAARAHVKAFYSYIANRPDLRAEPHGWRVPSVVRARVSVVKA